MRGVRRCEAGGIRLTWSNISAGWAGELSGSTTGCVARQIGRCVHTNLWGVEQMSAACPSFSHHPHMDRAWRNSRRVRFPPLITTAGIAATVIWVSDPTPRSVSALMPLVLLRLLPRGKMAVVVHHRCFCALSTATSSKLLSISSTHRLLLLLL